MPELLFDLRWPDGARETCYSPSTIVAAYFEPGAAYPLADFLERSRRALNAASERVRARHGAPCGRAAATLRAIERRAGGYASGDVTLERFHPG